MVARRWAIGGVLLLATVGGCANHWSVVRQTTPNPFTSKAEFSVEPPTFDAVGKQLAELKADAAPARSSVEQSFQQSLIDSAWRSGVRVAKKEAATPAAFSIRSRLVALEGGLITSSVGSSSIYPAEIKLEVEILDPSGKSLDLIRVEAIDSSNSLPGAADRLTVCAKAVGVDVGRYLASRLFQ